LGKWGVTRGEIRYKTKDGRELCEEDDWDMKLIAEYHPGLSEGTRTQKERYGEYRAGGVVSERFDMVFREEEVERVIGNLKKKKACGDDRVPNECMKYG